jgi:DNA polymerase
MSQDVLRAALVRSLQTDRLLGARAAPLSVPCRPGPAAQTRPATPAVAKSPTNVGPILTPPPPLPPQELQARKDALRVLDEQHVKPCTRCQLSQTRTKTVFGQGSPVARIVFVGEAPGHEEDIQGLAFVGRAGQLLTKMIEAMGLTRDQVFICNLLKCRPPNNRDPAPDELSSCWPYLDQQLRIIRSQVIVALGKPAAQTLLGTQESIGRLRGQWHDYYIGGPLEGGQPIPLMPTYHPAYLLRSPADKAKAWSDLKQVMQKLGLKIPR